jgi:hypothetical protein
MLRRLLFFKVYCSNDKIKETFASMIDDVCRSMGNAHIVFERDYLGDLGAYAAIKYLD